MVFQVSCVKKSPDEEILQQKDTSLFKVQVRDPLSEQAMADVVTYRTEFYGKTLYETIKYRLKDAHPENYLGENLKNSFPAALAAVSSENATKSTEERLQDVVAHGVITTQAAQKIRDFGTLIDGYTNTNPNFGEIYYAIKNFEMSIINSTTLNQDDMEPVLGIASMFRNHLKYQYELNGFTVDDRTEDCLFGRKVSCWKKFLTDAALDALKAGATVLVGSWVGVTSTKITGKGIVKILLASGIVGSVFNVIKLYRDETCKCGAEAPPDPCAPPKAIDVSIDNSCNPLEQLLEVLGQGSSANSFTYSITNGTFPAFGNITFVTTPSPSIVVRQNDPTIPIKVGVVANYAGCNGGRSVGPVQFDLPDIVNGTGTALVAGATNIAWGDPTIFTYECLGTWRANPSVIMTAIAPSYHGTLVSSTIATANIRWDQAKTFPYAPASVSATVKNVVCSQKTLSAWLTPIIIQ